MKIIHTVESYYPARHGMSEVVRQISENLALNGHEVIVATKKADNRKEKEIGGVKIVEFELGGNLVRGFTGDSEAYQDFLLNENFDILTNFAAQQWATDLVFPILEKISAKKVFVPTGFSGLFLEEYAEYFQSMSQWMRRYDANVFTSGIYQDALYAKENNIKPITIIPNGASIKEFGQQVNVDLRQRLGIPKDYLLILDVGSHTGLKGHRSAIEIFGKSNIRNVALLLVANDENGVCYKQCKRAERIYNYFRHRIFSKKCLKVVNLPRKETVAAFQQADLFLFTSEIECSPIVLFECMASKTPIITSDVGNCREIIEKGKSGVVLDTDFDESGKGTIDIEDGARVLENLCDNAELRKNMAQSGYVAWKEAFTWEHISIQYEALYSELLQNQRKF